MRVLFIRFPWPMWGFVLVANEKRLIARPILYELDSQISDDIRGVTFAFLPLAVLDQHRIVIKSLPWQNVPVIETGRIAAEMPFADHPGVIAGIVQILLDHW